MSLTYIGKTIYRHNYTIDGMNAETRSELKKAEGIIRSVARDYEEFEEAQNLEGIADKIGMFVEERSN